MAPTSIKFVPALWQNAVKQSHGTDDIWSTSNCTPTSETVLDFILAGHPAVDTTQLFATLPIAERQSVLCSVCSIHDEIACNCRDHGSEVSKLLASECPLFVDGRATCLETSL
jgi:hypothetical protein